MGIRTLCGTVIEWAATPCVPMRILLTTTGAGVQQQALRSGLIGLGADFLPCGLQ